ncbi:eukaryotic cytochrome b561 domain-containing protein [Phthorimaea operculella]|nr:eukaryotic cytochrome b561 domain-containing protein [Phthorimaea operculella]
MPAESVRETKIPDGSEAHSDEDSAFVKTVRLTLNLTTHILIILTVFVCLLYAWTSPELNAFQLHIVLCVIGYQFFMSQGTLVISKYNCWSMFLPRRYRRHLHWILQIIGVMLVTAGSCVMMKAKTDNFNTCHGVLVLMGCWWSTSGTPDPRDHVPVEVARHAE